MGTWENNDSLNLQALRQQILAMQQVHDQVVAPEDIAKTMLEELQGFNPLNTLSHSFWYFIGIILLMTCCFTYFQLELKGSNNDCSNWV
jgi:hypothetical protein